MIPLIDWLCHVFRVERDELEDFCYKNLDLLAAEIQGLPLYSSHSATRHALHMDGVTRAGAATLLARGGILGINLMQIFYEHTHGVMPMPRLPCLMRRHEDVLGETYYPIQMALVDRELPR